MRAIACLPLAALLAGCSHNLDKPIIENRYGTADLSMGATAVQLSLGVTTADAEESAGGVPLTALSDRAQAALVQATNGKPPIRLKAPGGGGATPRVAFQDVLKRTMVVSFRPQSFLPPGDRIDAIAVQLQVDKARSPGWKITGWTLATNGQETIELGASTRERSETFTAETGLKIGGPLADTSVGFESSRSASEEAKLKDHNIFDAAVDQNGVAWLEETAGWRESLAHNLAVDVVVTADPGMVATSSLAAFSDLTKSDDKGGSRPATPAEVMLSDLRIVAHGKQMQPVCGTASVIYRVRRIKSGAATFSESDDDVVFEKGTAAANFLLAPPPLRPIYGLWVGTTPLSYEIDGRGPAGLGLETLEEAVAFIDWLRSAKPNGGQLGNGKVGVVGGGKLRALTAAELVALKPGVVNAPQVEAARKALAAGCP